MESWREVWRVGFVPVLSDRHLEVLREALVSDDSRLLQGVTTTPPPLLCTQDWAVEAGCAISYCGWQGENLPLVMNVHKYFADKCEEADQRLGQMAACRWFLNWFDETPRDQMRQELIAEIDLALEARRQPSPAIEPSALPVDASLVTNV